MTYKGSNWTRGDLGHAIERDPMIPCVRCEDTYRYKNYWLPRYVNGKDWNPREVAWLCDECIENIRDEYELYQKQQANAQLTEFTA